MCGRYLLTSPVDALRQLLRFAERPNLMPRYNIAPTQEVPVVCLRRDASASGAPDGAGDDRERKLIMARWGLVPHWAKDIAIGARMINARAETVQRLPAFRDAYRRRRCLVPADGFFEWQKQGKLRQPLLIRRRDRAPLAFAGLHERWRQPDGQVVRSMTIITCPPNALVAPLHDRMPVILDPCDHARWLDPEAADGQSLLRPCPADWLEVQAVSRRVNDVRNDDPACIEPEPLQATLI
jgi:putative SOS response-associated peptidase YedK